MADKMTKKELKEPDALQRAGLEATSWVEGKEKLIIGAIVAAVLIFGGLAFADYLKDRSGRQARAALGAALEPLTRPVADPTATAEPADPGAEKPFASEKEKDEAIIASLTKFRSENPGTTSSGTAALPLAEALYRQGKYDEAAAAFADFLKDAPKDAPLRALALEGQGYAWEAKGDLDKALSSFDELAKQDAFLEGMGQFHKARVMILQGKKDDAAKALSEIPGAFPNTAAARMATERMNLLASQGVKVPPIAPPKPAADAVDAGSAQGS